ncbi:MAG TPA: histidinol dehydrogenase, partial [Verrucomicrobiae bacterium]|nr:histidinol dehydrogenase [Verrucomicrobiae bacterium]
MKVLHAGSRECTLFFSQLRSRQGTIPAEVEQAVRDILEGIRTGGDASLFAQTERFDGVRLDATSVRVRPEELEEAYA